jgi:radical SAM protein with 4Fe4S-binding SPASM domain
MQCPMPFLHMNIKPNKTATACWRCHENLGDYTNDSLVDIWNSNKWKDFRKQHLNNEKPEGCKSCWQMEDAGIKSTRQQVLEDYAPQIKELEKVNDLINPPFPRDMEFRFGNLCNMKCRHCSPKFSSQWVTQCKKDSDFYDTVKELSDGNLNYSINELPEDTMQQLKSFASNLDMIRITGGEPLMHPMHYEMLEVLEPYAKNITLEYNTNLHYLNNVLNYWKDYKKVICRVSIDADPSTYEFIREGGNLNKLVNNWNIVKSTMAEQIADRTFDLHATCTINVLNIVKIDKVIEFFTDLDSRLHVSFVQYPEVMDICNLPEWQKQDVKDKCNIGLEYVKTNGSLRLLNHAQQSVNKILKWIDKPSNAEFEDIFVKWMRAQDRVTKKCIFDYYTEFDYLKEKYYA